MTTYAQTIQAVLDEFGIANLSPREVEASMRCQYGTLDGLTLETFASEVVLALAVREEGLDLHRLADTYGLPAAGGAR